VKGVSVVAVAAATLFAFAMTSAVAGRPTAAADLRPSTGAEAEGVTPTIDRTISCATAFIGGARSVTAVAHHGTGRTGGSWDRPAFAKVTTGQTGSQYTLLDNALAWVTAGQPKKDSAVIQSPNLGVDYPLRVWGTLAWNTRLCRASTKKLPLTTKGLSGGSSGVFDEGADCNTPAHVLVRLRATTLPASKPTGFRQFLRIIAPVVRAELAVGTDSGKPLAYSEVLASGKARLLTARGCTPS